MKDGIEKMKYYICQIDQLLNADINNVEKKWIAPTCPANKILVTSIRKLYQNGQYEDWQIGKFNSAGDEKCASVGTKYEELKWLDVNLKPHREMCTATRDCVILKN